MLLLRLKVFDGGIIRLRAHGGAEKVETSRRHTHGASGPRKTLSNLICGFLGRRRGSKEDQRRTEGAVGETSNDGARL